MSDPSKPEEPEEKAPSALQDEIEAFVEGAAGLFDSLKDIFARSREEVVRGARLGKVRLDVYQLRKDREHKLQKLGEAAYALLIGGALRHPELVELFEELAGLDDRIAVGEAEISELVPVEEEVEAEVVVEPEPKPEAEVVVEPEPEPAKEPPKPRSRAKKKTTSGKPPAAKKKPARSRKKTEEK